MTEAPPKLAFILVDTDLLQEDPEVLDARYAAWIRLAKMSRKEVLAAVLDEWDSAVKWVASDSEKPGSFLEFCDAHNLEPSAVRRAIRKAGT